MKIWWCQEHDSGVKEGEVVCHGAVAARDGEPCRMVAMRLIPDNAETVERIILAIRESDEARLTARQLAEAILAALDGETP